jgi:hypothetical protein
MCNPNLGSLNTGDFLRNHFLIGASNLWGVPNQSCIPEKHIVGFITTCSIFFLAIVGLVTKLEHYILLRKLCKFVCKETQRKHRDIAIIYVHYYFVKARCSVFVSKRSSTTDYYDNQCPINATLLVFATSNEHILAICWRKKID